MSYDYWLVRTTEPVNALIEVDEPVVASFEAWERVLGLISEVLPEIIWSVDGEHYSGDGLSLEIGRFDISIDRTEKTIGSHSRPYAIVRVRGSHHSNQRDVIVSIANAIDFTALDIQSGDVLYSQTSFGEWEI